MRNRLICIILLLLVALPVMAQEETPEPEPDGLTFRSPTDPVFSFVYPADWRVEVDNEFTYFADGDEVNVLIEIVPLEADPFYADALENDSGTDPEDILRYYFGEADYSEPEIIELDEDGERHAARIDGRFESIYALYPHPDYFALLFVQGDERDDHEDEVLLIVTTLTEGEPEQVVEEDDPRLGDAGEYGPGLVSGAGGASTQNETGTLTMDVPDTKTAEAFEGIIFVEDDSGEFLMVVSIDRSLIFDMMGGTGDPDSFTTPESLLAAILGAEAAEMDGTIQPRSYGRMRAAVMEDMTTNALIAVVEVQPGILAVVFATTLESQLQDYASAIDSMIRSLQFSPG